VFYNINIIIIIIINCATKCTEIMTLSTLTIRVQKSGSFTHSCVFPEG